MQEKAERERREAERAEETRDLLSKTVLTIPAQVGAGDKLFGSVTNQDIAGAIYAARKIRVDKRNVDLEDPIKTVGTFMVKVAVHGSVDPAEVKVIVAPEGAKE
jgi:large subunit ribosomal protein L9